MPVYIGMSRHVDIGMIRIGVVKNRFTIKLYVIYADGAGGMVIHNDIIIMVRRKANAIHVVLELLITGKYSALMPI